MVNRRPRGRRSTFGRHHLSAACPQLSGCPHCGHRGSTPDPAATKLDRVTPAFRLLVLVPALALLCPAALPGATAAAAVPGPASNPTAAGRLPSDPSEDAAPPDRAAAGTGFHLPLDGAPQVLVAFRAPPGPYAAGHRGVDLAAPTGSRVSAAGPGVVVFAGRLAGRGVVSVQHSSGLRTTYEPVTPAVTRGQSVLAGAEIGMVDPGHATCAPRSCLHWGARLPDGSYLDPMTLLTGWRVRLKPWAG